MEAGFAASRLIRTVQAEDGRQEHARPLPSGRPAGLHEAPSSGAFAGGAGIAGAAGTLPAEATMSFDGDEAFLEDGVDGRGGR